MKHFSQHHGLRRFRWAVVAVLAIALPQHACTTSNPSAATTSITFSANAKTAKNLVVFVHGVLGDASQTWTNASGDTWPGLISRDPKLAGFATATVGYFTPAFSKASSIEEIATRVRLRLADEGVPDHYDEVYFVAHSMGGLVVKDVLEQMALERQDLSLRRVRAVFLIATPSQGAEVARIASMMSPNAQFGNMDPADANAFLQKLEDSWQDLQRQRLGDSFPKSYCAYETLPTKGILIVDRIHAATSCSENPIAVDADHSHIVKPADAQSDIYDWVSTRLRSEDMRYRAAQPPLPDMVRIEGGDSAIIRFGPASPRQAASVEIAARICPFEVSRTLVTRAQFRAFINETGHDTGSWCFVPAQNPPTSAGAKSSAGAAGSTISSDSRWSKASGFTWQTPGYEQDEAHPVVCVSYADASAYVDWLGRKQGSRYRLMSEAEWEYLARNATRPQSDSFPPTRPADAGTPDRFGLFGVLGDLWQWTEDCPHSSDLTEPPTDGHAWTSGGDCGLRVPRGKSSLDDALARQHYSSNIQDREWDIGFRVARTPEDGTVSACEQSQRPKP